MTPLLHTPVPLDAAPVPLDGTTLDGTVGGPRRPRRAAYAAGGGTPAWSSPTWSQQVDPVENLPEPLAARWREVVRRSNQEGDFEGARRELRALQALLESEGLEPEGDHGRSAEISRRLRCAELVLDQALGEAVAVEELRELLAHAESLHTQLIAAYEIAHALELARDWRKATFYGRIALSAARALADASWQATVLNLLGNVSTGASRFSEARGAYEEALEKGLDQPLWIAQVHDNLAYALAADGELILSRRHMAKALRFLRRQNGPARLSAELDAAFVLGLSDQSAAALRHALRGLRLARDLEDGDNLANALLLVAENAKRNGELFLAKRSIQQLAELRQEPDMAPALFHLDLLQTVNLRG